MPVVCCLFGACSLVFGVYWSLSVVRCVWRVACRLLFLLFVVCRFLWVGVVRCLFLVDR